MLTSLSIKNYAIIDYLEIDFSKGFSVVTGETGAGKSIIMGALGLVLGQRADAKSIKEGTDKCTIEACFDIADYNLQNFFSQNDLDYENTSIFRRELLSNGKSRAFINDSPVSLQVLKELGDMLIDIHSQHENLLLKDNSFQLKVVDAIAQNDELLNQFKTQFNHYKSLSQKLKELLEESNKNKVDKEYFEFQLQQLKEANIKDGEQTLLEEELQQLTHAEEIKTELSNINNFLANEEKGTLIQLKNSISSTKRIAKYLNESEDIESRLNTCYIELKDLANELETKQNKIDFEPQRIEYINQRLDLLYTLQQKHRVQSLQELILLQQELEEKLNKIESSDDETEKLQKEIREVHAQAITTAKKLTQSRSKASTEIAKELAFQLTLLGMPKIKFVISVTEKEDLSTTGMDHIDFMFSSNEQNKPQSVVEIASGGEIARVMLAIKSLIANAKALPTIIFDEIDTGISGEIADKMAAIMKNMSANMQVICITHLPQIAAKGDSHYRVFKDSSSTQIKRLSGEERIKELALMLSGSTISEAAIENAKALLKGL